MLTATEKDEKKQTFRDRYIFLSGAKTLLKMRAKQFPKHPAKNKTKQKKRREVFRTRALAHEMARLACLVGRPRKCYIHPVAR